MRDLLVIAGITVTAIIVGTLLFFFGPPSLQSDMISSLAATQQVGTTSVPYTVLGKGVDAISITSRTNYRITSQSDLSALWILVYGEKNAPTIPHVDFSKYEVLGLFDGSHASKGYVLELSTILDGNGIRLITISHQTQQSTCSKAPGISSPFEIVQVSKTSNTLKHQDVSATIACQAI